MISQDLLNSQSKEGAEFFDALNKVSELGAKPNMVDFFPFLTGLDPQRMKRNMELELGRTLNIVEGSLNEITSLRRKCVDNMIKYIEDDIAAAHARGESGELMVAHYTFVMAFNLIGNLMISRDLLNSQSKEGFVFLDSMKKAMQLAGEPNIADFFPFLEGLDPQRIKRKMEQEMGRTLNIVEGFVKERIEERKLGKKGRRRTFLMRYWNTKEMFFGGTETTSGTIEWAMAELLCSPNSMKRVKEELNQVVGPKRKVEESDVDELPYLQARLSRSLGATKRPPGPPAWPVFGNIFDLGTIPHRNLYKLRFKYGPVIWLRLGCTNALVIQSAKAAEELFKNHDVTFSDRKVPESFTAHNYNEGSLSLGRYGPNWRLLRRVVTMELMTNKRINDTAFIRRKCIDDMINILRRIEKQRLHGEKQGS
ncbi:hypothetical protein GH714_038592 [Hevea brasiliensis]|uniref:Cytochrome P450 n=1 Tax=Hevea brasiliensis TaxID=3981 RepID=A0A6A6KPC0_HEVBR|nr:hypothetical protein GH714_038592 [Hevea brasiliensis]